MGKEIKIYYDKEGDYMEVLFELKEGYFKETEHDELMEKIDKDGNVIGFSILRFSHFQHSKPLSVTLK
ncbi:MAG: DUF2283 domain-containing protein [Ignavibacteria bacterium]|nr:DUF2283 domain-containing protein [Ignavibacteria bacterium]